MRENVIGMAVCQYNRAMKSFEAMPEVELPHAPVSMLLGEAEDADEPPSTNAQLRKLVKASGLPQAVAMTIFNRGLGAAACFESQWRGFLAEPDSERFQVLSAEQLKHAVTQFALIGVTRG